MRKYLVIGFMLCASVALAQTTDPTPTVVTEDTSVTFPVGLWVSVVADLIQNFVAPFLGVVIGWILLLVPGWARILLGTVLTDRNLEKAIQYALNMVEGATADKTLTIDVGNEVIAKAAQYFIDSVPKWLVTFAGGPAAIEQKVIARLPNLPVGASASTLDPRSPYYKKPHPSEK